MRIIKTKNFKRLSVLLVAAVFVTTPLRFRSFLEPNSHISAGYVEEIITQDTVWGEGEHVKGYVRIKNGATLTIEPGAIIKFSSVNSGYGMVGMHVFDGNIVAEGTEKKRIVFTADTEEDRFNIFISSQPENDPSFFRWVEFSRGGYFSALMGEKKEKFLNKALAVSGAWIQALFYVSGRVHVENCEFKDNFFGDVRVQSYFEDILDEENYIEIVNSNFSGGEKENDMAVVANDFCDEKYSCGETILLKNNWYGDASGPRTEDNKLAIGQRITGDYILDGWRSSNLIVDPVVIIPGITGSAQWLGEWKLDPMTHTYDNLVDSLKSNGYVEGASLFEFPYEWRNNNKTTAHYLQSRVEGIIQTTRVSKVDVVAHSMGGLVARAYIEEIGGVTYEDTIDQLITLGTPHRGSPEAYLKWEAGEGFFTWKDKLAKHHFKQEAEEEGYEDLQKYIQEKVSSVGELLPDYDYISRDGDVVEYFEGYPRNMFLEELNEDKNVKKLVGVEYTNIIGKLDIESTISKIRVVDSLIEGKWEHGMPENFYDDDTDQGLVYLNGDETVPVYSAKSVPSDKTIDLDSTHGDLPTKAQCEIFRELSGKHECKYENNWHITNMLLFNVFSPIDIRVVSPDGKIIGKDFSTGESVNEIPGAFYSGFDTKNEFITIPNPEDGEYKIFTQGTEDGSYRIETVKISQNAGELQDGAESKVVFKGEVKEGYKDEFKVNVKGDNVVEESKDISAPVIYLTVPEGREYMNNQLIVPEFSIIDEVSSPENIVVRKYINGQFLYKKEIDLAFLHLGKNKFKIEAVDEAGNRNEKEVVFAVATDPKSLQDNVIRYFNLGLIKSRHEKQRLLTSLYVIQKKMEFLDSIKNNNFISPKGKEKIEQAVTRDVGWQIDFIILHINKYSKMYDFQAREFLLESLLYLK